MFTQDKARRLHIGLVSLENIGEQLLGSPTVSTEALEDYRQLVDTLLVSDGIAPRRRSSVSLEDDKEDPTDDLDLVDLSDDVEEDPEEEIDLDVPDNAFMDDEEEESEESEEEDPEESEEESEEEESEEEEPDDEEDDDDDDDDDDEFSDSEEPAEDLDVPEPTEDSSFDESDDVTTDLDAEDPDLSTDPETEVDDTPPDEDQVVEDVLNEVEEEEDESAELSEQAEQAAAEEEAEMRRELAEEVNHVKTVSSKVGAFITKTDDSGHTTDAIKRMAELQTSNESFKSVCALDHQLSRSSKKNVTAVRADILGLVGKFKSVKK